MMKLVRAVLTKAKAAGAWLLGKLAGAALYWDSPSSPLSWRW